MTFSTGNIVAVVAVALALGWLRWSLKQLGRPQRWTAHVWKLREDEANEAWANGREEAYDAALLIAWRNGDILAELEGTGAGASLLWPADTPVLDPHSQRA